jgi:hypothetical protein
LAGDTLKLSLTVNTAEASEVSSGGMTSSSQGGGGTLDLTLLLVLMLPVGVRLATIGITLRGQTLIPT